MRFAIVMAAGKGTRMHSKKTKVMHQVLDKPMIGHVYQNLKQAGVSRIVMVVGHGKEQVQTYLNDSVEYAIQEPQLGTGHCVMQATQLQALPGKTIIFNGDCPLVQPSTIEALFKEAEFCDLALLTAKLDDGKSYGRIIREEDGSVSKIVEFKDCSFTEKQITEINAGIYCIDNELLWKYLPYINNDNAQKEYYITDLVEILKKHQHRVHALICEDPQEIIGINDRVALAQATQYLQKRVNRYWLKHGVTILDPSSTYISTDTTIEEDVTIYPQVICEGTNHIGADVILHSGTYLKNASIGEGTTILSSRITDSKVGKNVTIGPNSHLRNQCDVGDMVRIGNFVELKNTSFGYNTKCAHLTYVGDSTVGEKVNFGCGVVTVNYDGKNKYHTTIEDGAFIGSNVNLIAPVHIGKNALLAAGSTINKDVEDGDMGIARSRQETVKGFGQKYKTK